MASTVRLRDRLGAVAVITALAMAAAACTSESTDDLPPPVSPPPTEAEPEVDPEHQAILDVYYGSVAAMVEAQQAGDPDHPDLTRYFSEGAIAHENARSGVQRHVGRGTYYEGELEVVSATVVEIDTEGQPTATIESCLDDSEYQLVNREDGLPVPDTQPGGRYEVTSRAVLGPDGNWYITETIAHWEESC